MEVTAEIVKSEMTLDLSKLSVTAMCWGPNDPSPPQPNEPD